MLVSEIQLQKYTQQNQQKTISGSAHVVHHNLFMTLWLGSNVLSMLVAQQCLIQTKNVWLYRKGPFMTICLHHLHDIWVYL